MRQHEMQQSNIYLGIYIIEYYLFWKKSGCYITRCASTRKPARTCACNACAQTAIRMLAQQAPSWRTSYQRSSKSPNCHGFKS
jgi:hypothetical protein